MVTQHPLQVSVNNNTIDFSLAPSACTDVSFWADS